MTRTVGDEKMHAMSRPHAGGDSMHTTNKTQLPIELWQQIIIADIKK